MKILKRITVMNGIENIMILGEKGFKQNARAMLWANHSARLWQKGTIIGFDQSPLHVYSSGNFEKDKNLIVEEISMTILV